MRNPFSKLSKNARTALVCVGMLVFMICFTAAAVPLYYLLCRSLGIANPGVIAASSADLRGDTGQVSDRVVTVRFISNVNKGVPVKFTPLSTSIRVKLGDYALTAYSATNTSPKAMDGVAVHMLYPMGGNAGSDIAKYVDLQQCFCFESQHYPGSSTIKLPLSFRILPSLPEGIHTITFAYTLFEALPDDPRIKNHDKK